MGLRLSIYFNFKRLSQSTQNRIFRRDSKLSDFSDMRHLDSFVGCRVDVNLSLRIVEALVCISYSRAQSRGAE